jgi:hypothetical protein
MSPALVEAEVQSSQTTVIKSPKIVGRGQTIPPAEGTAENGDPHPLVPVFVIGGIALICSVAFVGSIVVWLVLGHSGVMAR